MNYNAYGEITRYKLKTELTDKFKFEVVYIYVRS